MPLLKVLCAMESEGINLDIELLKNIQLNLIVNLMKTQKR